jgi:hypothetical protein
MKVDVIINVYGKPWQTICTLKSLQKYSGNNIDKIYLIKEKNQPYNENIDFISKYFDNIITYTPKYYNFTKHHVNHNDIDDILSVRYQYGIEKTDKKFVFITHNDVLYNADIIGNMLNKIGDAVGIGEIGQCWNCPAKLNNLCSGEKFNDWNPTYNDIINLGLPHVRTNHSNIDNKHPKPLPECRLNEWACLIDVEKTKKENYPYNNIPYFGQYSGVDLGCDWFKEMYLKGYKFIDHRTDYIHGYWANNAGYPTQLNVDNYKKSEDNAKIYYEQHFNN